MLNILLEEKIKFWKSLPRNNQEELKIADDFFDYELMPLSIKSFLKRQQGTKTYYGMMLTLGTSWQPLALAVALLKPQKLLVMCTQDTLLQFERLKNFLGLQEQQYKLVIVNRSESEDIYEAMRQFYEKWSVAGDICVDITGGTKAMSSSAAMMGALLGIDIYYVESKYLPLYRRPEPGSEYIKQLTNPKMD